MESNRKLVITSPIMTGDIPHVAGALALDTTVDVLVIYEKNERDDTLIEFYKRAAGKTDGRVKSCSPDSGEAKYLISRLTSKSQFDDLIVDVPLFIKTYLTYGSKFYLVIPVGIATSIIADRFKKAENRAETLAVHEKIIGTLAYEPTEFPGVIKEALEGGVFGKLPPRNENPRILLLWARYSGQKENGHNPQGDSDVTGQDQLSKLARAQGFTVIRIGHGPFVDPREETEDYHLHEFYSKPLIQNAGRAGQVSFFVALKEYYYDKIIQMGQKTGGMDSAALVGIPTLYIEDVGSLSKNRMTKWVAPGAVPFYRCAFISQPPSSLGKAMRLLSPAVKEIQLKDPKFKVTVDIERMSAWAYAFKGQLKGVEATANVKVIVSMVYYATWAEWDGWMKQIEDLGKEGLEIFKVPAGYIAEDETIIKKALMDLTEELVNAKIL